MQLSPTGSAQAACFLAAFCVQCFVLGAFTTTRLVAFGVVMFLSCFLVIISDWLWWGRQALGSRDHLNNSEIQKHALLGERGRHCGHQNG